MTWFADFSFRAIARRGARRLLHSKQVERAKSWLRGSGPAERFGIEVSGDRSSADVVAYFGDSPGELYQLQQWIPALEALNETRPVVLVVRQRASFVKASSLTSLPCVLAISYPDLTDLYAENDYRAAIYVNNSMRNFQSMSDPSIVHIHVDHGESDKVSSISNQLKAYDKVFVAGLAAEERCERALWGFDRSKLEKIGRPPLDGEFESVLPEDGRLTVVYAPTWQGENEANNFTSIDVLGPRLISALIAAGHRVVYRPHPRTADLSESEYSAADRDIRFQIDDANFNGGKHFIATQCRILDLFEDADVLIADISSVSLDFLYLHVDKGLLITDRWNDHVQVQSRSPLGSALGALSVDTLDHLPTMVEDSLRDGQQFASRKRLKDYYFSVETASESTRAFVSAVGAASVERDVPED